MLKKIFYFKLLLIFTIFSTNIFSQNLTIYTEISPPDQFVDEKGNLTGFAVEIVNEIQKKLGTNYKIEIVPWARGYKACQTEPNVVLFLTNRTAERNPQFQWVGPLAETSFGFYVKADSKLKIENMEDAKKVKSIGVYLNDVRDLYLTKQGFKNLERVPDNILNYKKLMSDRIEVMAGSSDSFYLEAKEAGFKESDFKLLYTFLKAQKYITFSLNTPKEIVDKWQVALDELKKDGTFKKIHNKYFPNKPLPGPPATELP